MALYTFQCPACDATFEDFCASENIGTATRECKCGHKKAVRIFTASRGPGIIQDTLENPKGKHISLKVKSDKWPKDKYGRPVVYSRSQEKAVMRQVYEESGGTSRPVSHFEYTD